MVEAHPGGGLEALRARKATGAPCRLTPEPKGQLPALLAQGAEAFGFRGDVWTQARIAAVIQQRLGVTYHPSHMCRLLRQIGWSRQKPISRATQRKEDAIQHWWQERWPALPKKG